MSADDQPEASEATPKDVVLVHGLTDDGKGLAVLRARNGELEAGACRPLEHGKPIHGEVVRLKPRKECPVLCDVETALPAPAARERSGPAQVATRAYRDNWDAIFASRAN